MRSALRASGTEEDAYLGNLTDQSDGATDVVVHPGTVHAGGEIGHLEVVMARGKDYR